MLKTAIYMDGHIAAGKNPLQTTFHCVSVDSCKSQDVATDNHSTVAWMFYTQTAPRVPNFHSQALVKLKLQTNIFIRLRQPPFKVSIRLASSALLPLVTVISRFTIQICTWLNILNFSLKAVFSFLFNKHCIVQVKWQMLHISNSYLRLILALKFK